MSLKRNKNVAELVEKYLKDKELQNLERDLLRRIIRVENPALFNPQNESYSSNLRKLDRYLKKVYNKKPNRILKAEERINDSALSAWNPIWGQAPPNWFIELGRAALKLHEEVLAKQKTTTQDAEASNRA